MRGKKCSKKERHQACTLVNSFRYCAACVFHSIHVTSSADLIASVGTSHKYPVLLSLVLPPACTSFNREGFIQQSRHPPHTRCTSVSVNWHFSKQSNHNKPQKQVTEQYNKINGTGYALDTHFRIIQFFREKKVNRMCLIRLTPHRGGTEGKEKHTRSQQCL